MAYLIRKNTCWEKYIFLLKYSCQLWQKNCSYVFIVARNMIISWYLSLCCSVLKGVLLNLFKCTNAYSIFHNECKIPDHATGKMSNLHMDTKYRLLKYPITFRQECSQWCRPSHSLSDRTPFHQTSRNPMFTTNSTFEISRALVLCCLANLRIWWAGSVI